MFGFIEKMFLVTMPFFSYTLNSIPLKCVSMNNQKCRIRPGIINTNINEPIFYPYSIKVNKCSGSCNIINDSYAKLCVPDVVKNTKIKVFNLMSRTNETRHRKCHETCQCKFRLDASVFNNKLRWNNDKCRCESKELIDKEICDEVFIWNPSKCERECDKSCDVWEYLDYANCKCRERLIDKLVEECSENIDGNELIYNATLNDHGKVCSSCTVYMVLLVIFFIISIGISCAFIYFYWYLKKDITNINANTETVIYWMQFHWTCKWGISKKLTLKIEYITFLMTWLILNFWFKPNKNRQKVIQKCWYLLYWIYHNERFWICKI